MPSITTLITCLYIFQLLVYVTQLEIILCTIAFHVSSSSTSVHVMKNLITFVYLLQDTDMMRTTHKDSQIAENRTFLR